MKRVKLFQTARDTNDRLTEKTLGGLGYDPKEAVRGTGEAAVTTLTMRPERTFQKIIGFGGAFTESAAYTFYKMEPEKRKDILKKYFDPDEGIGYSIGRVHINSCDFSLGNYTYVKDNDAELASFDISHEEQWMIPLVREAEAVRKDRISLLASPWSPPGWMKSNKEMNHGGTLLPQYKEAWARYYAKYISAMRTKGLNIWAVTVQNEPAAVQTWDSCIYSAEEEGLFVRDYLGPILEQEKLSDIKIYVWDHNRDIIVERAVGAMSVSGAEKYIYGFASHWYESEAFENLSKVHELFPDRHILFSEGCQEGGVHLGSWATGERYGRNMIGDFNNWQEGWLDWNLLLDETGGPNHVGNLCDAPVIADTKSQQIHYNSSYYYIGQFSKFVKPGAVRIGVDVQKAGCDSGAQAFSEKGLQYVAFLNEDGTIVLIVMNETDKPQRFNADAGGQQLPYTMPAHSIVTLLLL